MKDIADPSSTSNRNGTVKENNEGTLDICKCGREFFVSFQRGLVCNDCRNSSNKKMKKKISDFAKSARKQIYEDKLNTIEEPNNGDHKTGNSNSDI